MDKDKIFGVPASSRRNFLKVAALAGTGVALGGQALALPARAATDDPPAIINIALTAEYLAVTFQSNALRNATALQLSAAEVTTIQAIVAEEALHVAYLQAYGASALASTFAFPAGTFSSRTTYANTAIVLETAFVAAYMAAVRDFAGDQRADLAQLAYQIGAVEAEHRALSRVILGAAPFSDKAFQSNLVPDVASAATFLANQGFLSPTTGNSYPYLASDQAAALGYTYLLSQKQP